MANLIRFSPTGELRRMQREIDRLFDDFLPSRAGNGEGESATWAPRVDLSETRDAYLVRVDAPGMKKEDFNISWQDDTLTISGERKWQHEEKDENFVRVERSFGHFFRSFRIPQSVNGDGIDAAYEDGVLTIRVPKTEESKPRRIDIK